VRVEEFVGVRVRDRREELGMTQEELGQLLGHPNLLGRPWTKQAVSAAEQGKRAFTAAELFALSVALQTRIPRLLMPPVTAREIEMPGGGIVELRTVAPDIGVVDKSLGDLYDRLAPMLRDIKVARDAAGDALTLGKDLEDRLTTAIGAIEAATMHSDEPEREQ
jgi:transcriptional regulator with XRE-family HTH domain